jgi:hypothetical protein
MTVGSTLTKKQTKGLKTLSVIEDRFTPLQLLRITSEIADQLVQLGLAECGECSERYKELFLNDTGYRLTKAGRGYLNSLREKSPPPAKAETK